MKVNMVLISGEPEEEIVNKKGPPEKKRKEKKAAEKPVEEPKEEEEDEVLDESDKHSKIKTVLLVAAMIGGFAIFVWNMTNLVNNMRLDNQGSPSVVYETDERLDSYTGEEGSGAVDVSELSEEETPEDDTVRAGPGDTEAPVYANESEEMAALRQERDEARNNEELMRRQLKNAEDMLDSSLQREAELQNKLGGQGGN